jgi:DNA-binding transcriptional ArsR family regulator
VERLDLAQSTVSQHLKVLVDAGLVRFSPDRQRSRYELDGAALKHLASSLAALVDDCCA